MLLMKKITFSVDNEILEKVRIVAAHRRTTVNALVREFLTEIAGREERKAEARKELLRLANESKGHMAPGWKFDREETHER
jgi:predicted transcriptional regulator